MVRDRDHRPDADAGEGDGDVGRLSPGKRALTQALVGQQRPGRHPPADVGKRTLTQGLPPIRAAGKGGGVPLPDSVRDHMEQAFGVDFGAVRIHQDGGADPDTRAYAQGTDIHFAPGQYDPSSAEGLELLGHELTHVVQQAEGRVLPEAGHGEKHGKEAGQQQATNDTALEAEADALGARAAAGNQVMPSSVASHFAGGTAIQKKTVVNPVATTPRLNKVQLLGDGTPANKGLTCKALDDYVTKQGDWFTESTLTAAERDQVWKVLLLMKEGSHVKTAIASLLAGEVAGLAPGDLAKLKKYTTCFNTAAETIQLTTAATTMARAQQLGQAIIDLEAFVPTPVMRVVIPEAGLIYLVDKKKITELQSYYKTFKPTLEVVEEWPHVQTLLDETVAKWAPLAAWIHDAHIFTTATRTQLLANVADKSRSRPVLLILFSALDHNKAFLQAANMQASVLNAKNLALVIQGATSMATLTADVNRVADDYGQRSLVGWDWKAWGPIYTKGKLGQVVLAGHGGDQTIQMTSPGTGAKAENSNQHVSYDKADVDSSDPKANGTELLIDTVLSRMDPKDANVVFAGCLVGSHEFPASTNVSGGSAAAQKSLQGALAAHPNLSDYVRGRMAAAGITGTVQAANGSTTFDSFQVDATGKAKLANPGDPDISGTKLQYVRTGIEPEGALRAALECYADTAIGPAKVTAEIRTRVAGLAANHGWWETCTRLAFEQCLPPAPAEVDPAKLLDIVHRVPYWFFGGWANMINVQWLADTLTPAEAPVILAGLLTSNWVPTHDHMKVGFPEAWIKFDASKTADFMTALNASSLLCATLKPLLARGIIDPHLATLLPTGGAPTKGQMLLALTIADDMAVAMPAAVKDFLRDAAGGKTTTAFPAVLGVTTLLPSGEDKVLERIGLAPSAGPVVPSKGGPTVVDGNVDANKDKKNEVYIQVSPHEATVNVKILNKRARPDVSAPVIGTLTLGTVVKVMGKTESGWSVIDDGGAKGTLAFVDDKYLT